MKLKLYDEMGIITNEKISSLLAENSRLLEQAKVGHDIFGDSLGWLNPEEWADSRKLDIIKEVAGRIRKDADAFVLIGVGGSNNAARSVIEALKGENALGEDSPEIIYMGNTLSANATNKMLKRLEGKSFYINIIAKNFETLEPGVSFRILRHLLYRKYGSKAAGRIVATGTPGSSLDALCQEHGYTFLAFPENIGGRYSALCNVGLLPMAVVGIDIDQVVQGAKDIKEELYTAPAKENTALQYACIRNLLYLEGYSIEMLSSFEPQFRWFGQWWIQLFAESEGKDGEGLFPVASEYSEQLHSVGQYVQDGKAFLFETFLTVRQQRDSLILKADGIEDHFDYLNDKDLWEVNYLAYQATLKSHSQKLPCLTLEIERIDGYNFGKLFYFFEFACYLSGMILGIDPFDQPGVESYKKRMFQALGK